MTTMASAGSTQALIQRRQADLARMPPPPTKRIKRPAEVLDEDEYTDALSDIIARDYFPGLQESKAQEEYLNALESKNQAWIKEAGQRLQQARTPQNNSKTRRTTRDTRYDTPRSYRNAEDTPRGFTGEETPRNDIETGIKDTESSESKGGPNTSDLSLSAFQAKYTSEDNESFNTLLDKQNTKKREKYSYMWTPDQRLLSERQITYRANHDKLLKEKAEYESVNSRALIPLTSGATSERSAKPDNWKQKTPNNSLMFTPDSVDEQGFSTIMEAKEAASNAGPKQVVHENTRFPPSNPVLSQGTGPSPSPSIHTSMIARRLKPSGSIATMSNIDSEFSGNETPRVNGYAYVDEDEPDYATAVSEEPSYRDLLAGQVSDGTPNPFKINDIRKREDLHHKLVEREAARKRMKEKETTRSTGSTGKEGGNMTPAARKLMEKIGRTPVRSGSGAGGKDDGGGKEMWTPGATPRRKLRNQGG